MHPAQTPPTRPRMHPPRTELQTTATRASRQRHRRTTHPGRAVTRQWGTPGAAGPTPVAVRAVAPARAPAAAPARAAGPAPAAALGRAPAAVPAPAATP